MSHSKIREDLLPILDRYGPDPVEQTLEIAQKHGVEPVCREYRNMRLAGNRETKEDFDSSSRAQRTREGSSKKKPTAFGYISKMELHPGKRAALIAAAKQFENCSFLPTIADIRCFWENYELGEPAPRTRVSAIARVFSFISTMDTEEIEKTLDSGLFSGPTRLGPISDAIRGKGTERVEDIELQNRVVSRSTSTIRENRTKNKEDNEFDENTAA